MRIVFIFCSDHVRKLPVVLLLLSVFIYRLVKVVGAQVVLVEAVEVEVVEALV